MHAGRRITSYWLLGKYPLQYLQETEQIGSFIDKTSNEITSEDIEKADIIYNIRCVHSGAYSVFEEANRLKKPFIYITDDDFFTFSEEDSAEKKRHVRFAQNFLAQIKVAVVTTKPLYNIVQKHNANTMIFPPYQIIPEENTDKKERGIIKIGHMSTLKREAHFDFIIPAIKRILDEFDEVRFESIGYCPSELIAHRKAAHFDFMIDYGAFQKFFSSRKWDIGLAPLMDTPATRCKTDNKFREFGAFKICGIYSNVPCYIDSVQHQRTGYIVDNTEEEWYQAMKYLLSYEKLRKKIVKKAYKKVSEDYKLEDFSYRLRNLFIQ